jgi:hypothetical protein
MDNAKILYIAIMKLAYTYWQNNGFYVGYLNEYPVNPLISLGQIPRRSAA